MTENQLLCRNFTELRRVHRRRELSSGPERLAISYPIRRGSRYQTVTAVQDQSDRIVCHMNDSSTVIPCSLLKFNLG